MALFKYKVIDQNGDSKSGTIDAVTRDVAISSLQRRGFVIESVQPADDLPFFKKDIAFFSGVSGKEIVVLSRQIATLFGAQVSALKVFRLLSAETENGILANALSDIADELQGGSSISKALAKHPKIFSEFYVNMVKAGEESGKLDEIFGYLADYLDRTNQVTSKARNALIYPSFVILTFIVVMVLMLTFVIPRIGTILTDAGQEIPIYTKIVLGISSMFVNYGLFILILLVVGGFFMVRYLRTDTGKIALDRAKISIPFVGNLYRKLYLSRISDNMHTMLLSGISMVKSLEVSADVVGNKVYEEILISALEEVKAGEPLSRAIADNDEIPNIMVQMIKVGEETGELGNILNTLSTFYRREVNGAVDTLVDLIEPVMIVLLGLGVGFILASVLIPIYNISATV